MKLIIDSTSLIEILQYSVRAKDSKTLIEFVLSITAQANKHENTNQAEILEIVFRTLKDRFKNELFQCDSGCDFLTSTYIYTC